jgi:hypothetical protein
MQNQVVFQDLFWHDGRIANFETQFDLSGSGSVKISVSLHQSINTQERVNWILTMSGVLRVFTNFDACLLKQNFKFGNINEGKYFDNEQKKLVIVLTEGYAEVIGSNLEIKIA